MGFEMFTINGDKAFVRRIEKELSNKDLRNRNFLWANLENQNLRNSDFRGSDLKLDKWLYINKLLAECNEIKEEDIYKMLLEVEGEIGKENNTRRIHQSTLC